MKTFDPESIDPIIHTPARMLLMRLLTEVESVDCSLLIRSSGLTWGNLSVHLTKMEQAGYVAITKGFNGRRPQTMVKLTDLGREKYEAYRKVLSGFVGDPG